MSENAFLTWYEILQDKILSAIDNLIATPVNNLMLFLSMEWQKPAPGSDARDPYPFINESRYATGYKESVFVGTILSVIGSIVISVYKSVRDKESISNYFFFERIFSLVGNNNEASIQLRTVAYFYNPDVSPMVLWVRRAWASLMGNSDLKNLEKYLNKTQNTKETSLKEIYKEINEQLASFITNKERYGKWSVEKQAGEWRIKPPTDYLEAWRRKKEEQEKGNSTHSIAEKTKKTVLSPILSFINSRLDELGRASFVYWIGFFTFCCFFPGIGVVGGIIIWPPILIAGLFLVAIWIIKGYTFCQRNKQPKFDSSEKAQKATIEFIAAVKHQIQLEALLEQGIGTLSYEKIKFKKPSRESKLFKDIRGVFGEKCTLVGVRAIFNGFVIGCFTIFFSSWLIYSTALVFVTVSPATLPLVGMVVALVTLGLGLVYGSYFAKRKYNEEREKFLNAEAKFLKLQKTCGDLEIPDISLRECDRLFRRGTTKPRSWTFIKQGFKRVWTGAIRLGTGILLFKLLAMGIALAVLSFFYSVVTPPFCLMLILMLAGGLFFAGCHIWLYHCGSKEDQAVRIMDFFLNRPYDLESSHFSSAPILAEKKKEDDLLEPRFDDPLNINEVCFYKLRMRRISSESRLNALNLNGMQGPTETDYNDINVIQNSEASSYQRKRSDTFPGTAIVERERNAGIVQKDDFLNKKIEKIPEPLVNTLMNKNRFNNGLVRRASSESCLDDRDLEEAKDAKIVQNSEDSIPQRKRSDTLPSTASFGRKRKIGITTNYIETFKSGMGISGL